MQSGTRRLATAWLWLAGILALALIGAACDDFVPGPAESPVPPAPTPAIELAPTETPTPTATPLPTPTPTAVPPTPLSAPVEPSCALNPPEPDHPTLSARDEAWRFLFDLTREFSPRESATDEEYAAGEELNCLLTEIGYVTEFQRFGRLANVVSSVIVVSDAPPGLEAIQSLPIQGSFEGEMIGELVFVGFALPEDVGEQRLDGKVALIERGEISFQEKAARVAAAGAVGAVIFNQEDELFQGLMINEDVPAIPAVGISRGDGLALREAIESGGLDVNVGVRNIYEPSRNLIAELPGRPGRQGVVILGAHYDTVHSTEGANDNGSGLTALMAIANRIIDTDYPFTVRLILFGSEEVRLLGSRHYVEQLTDEERDEIIAMINFDSTGTGETLESWGHLELTGAAAAYAAKEDIPFSPTLTRGVSSSDHRPFHEAGTPAIIITADDVSRINSSRDTLDFVDAQLIAWAADIGIGLLDHLARTPLSVDQRQ